MSQKLNNKVTSRRIAWVAMAVLTMAQVRVGWLWTQKMMTESPTIVLPWYQTGLATGSRTRTSATSVKGFANGSLTLEPPPKNS